MLFRIHDEYLQTLHKYSYRHSVSLQSSIANNIVLSKIKTMFGKELEDAVWAGRYFNHSPHQPCIRHIAGFKQMDGWKNRFMTKLRHVANLELSASKHLVRRDKLLHKSGGSSVLATGKNRSVVGNFMG
jgi:hypothetical protein